MASGREIGSFFGHRSVRSVAFSPDGKLALSGSDDNTILHVVHGLESYALEQFYGQLNRPDLVQSSLAGGARGAYRAASASMDLETIIKSGPAPKLERLKDRDRVEGGTLRLAVRLVDQGGGIGETVVWKVNGKVQEKTTAPGLVGPARAGREVVMEQVLADLGAEDEIEVTAYNGEGLLASEPLRFRAGAANSEGR